MTKILTRKSKIRLEEYDYSQTNHYSVTICSNKRKECFGEIKNNEMILNNYGSIIKQKWEWLPQQYPYVELDEYIIMPNHLHGILIINNSIRTGHDLSLHKIKPLSSLIGAFKTTSSKLIRQNGLSDFAWQRSFHDHIIRNEKSLDSIREYIVNNPTTWDNDKNNVNSLKVQALRGYSGFPSVTGLNLIF